MEFQPLGKTLLQKVGRIVVEEEATVRIDEVPDERNSSSDITISGSS